jgi:hypothetical protein
MTLHRDHALVHPLVAMNNRLAFRRGNKPLLDGGDKIALGVKLKPLGMNALYDDVSALEANSGVLLRLYASQQFANIGGSSKRASRFRSFYE